MRIYFENDNSDSLLGESINRQMGEVVKVAKTMLAPMQQEIEQYPDHMIIFVADPECPYVKIKDIPNDDLQKRIFIELSRINYNEIFEPS